MSYTHNKQELGKSGEELACNYLINKNYHIVERNFKCTQGEIDIIAFDKQNKEMVFIEVKTRTNFNYGVPSESVNKQKQRHLKNSIKYYLHSKKIEDIFVRIDVIEIVVNKENYKLNHIIGVL